MVTATRSGFDGVASRAGCAPGDREGNSVTWFVLGSLLAVGADGKAFAAVGGCCGSSAGAVAVAMPADDVLPPSKRFQSDGGGETFQIFAGDSSSTPTWKSSLGLAGGWTD